MTGVFPPRQRPGFTDRWSAGFHTSGVLRRTAPEKRSEAGGYFSLRVLSKNTGRLAP